MKLEDGDIEDIDMQEDYEMVPLEPMLFGCSAMNRMQGMGMPMQMPMPIPMACIQDVNPNGSMNSLMGMNQNTGINPWNGMGQFDENVFDNDFQPMRGVYGDEFMNDFEEENEEENEESGKIDKYEEKDSFREQYSRPNPQHNDVESIVKRIEKYNPAIFRRLTRCGIPYAEAIEIVRRIVRVSLMYREE